MLMDAQKEKLFDLMITKQDVWQEHMEHAKEKKAEIEKLQNELNGIHAELRKLEAYCAGVEKSIEVLGLTEEYKEWVRIPPLFRPFRPLPLGTASPITILWPPPT